MRTPSVVSVPLPATGGLVDVLAGHGQTYVRDIQKDLVPRIIANSGHRWHNAAARSEMIQILRYLTIRKGGVYIHWDALAARSHNLRANNEKALAARLGIAASHAHGASCRSSSSECLRRKNFGLRWGKRYGDSHLLSIAAEMWMVMGSASVGRDGT